MTRAAEGLHVAQPSLGVQIKLLEGEMGVELLERHSRGVSPTAAGKLLYERATHILAQVEALRAEVGGIDAEKRRSVALGFPPSTIKLLGVDILSDAEKFAPGMTIELTEERSAVLEEALDRNELDAALCYNVKESPKIVCTPVLEEELLFVAAPDQFSSEEPVSAADVLKTSLVLSGDRGVINGLVHAEARKLKQPLKPAFSIQSVSTLKSIVKQGKAATVMPLGPIAEDIESGTMAYRRIRGRPLYRTLYLVRTRASDEVEDPGLQRLFGEITRRLREKLGDLAKSVA